MYNFLRLGVKGFQRLELADAGPRMCGMGFSVDSGSQ